MAKLKALKLQLPKLTREQAIAVGALGAFFIICVVLMTWSIEARVEAARELFDRQDVLARLETGIRAKIDARGPIKHGKAPPAAFLDAPTLGLASAALESHVTQLAGHHATLVSFAVRSGSTAEPADAVRIEASMDINLDALQSLLYDLESGTPYVFLETMTVRPAAASAQAADPLLRATLGLRALWRHRPI